MMIPTLRSFTFLILTLQVVVPSLLFSQAPEEAVSINFQAIGWASASDTEELFYMSGGEKEEISALYATLRSDTYTYRGPPNLRIWKMIRNEAGEMIPQPAGSVRIPLASKNLLLIFFDEGDGTYRILPLEDDLTLFPPGSYNFINISNSKFAVQVDKELKHISYGESAIFKIPPGEAKSVDLLMAKNEEGEWEKFHQTVIPHHTTRRVIFFLVEKEVRGRKLVQMRQLVDYPSED